MTSMFKPSRPYSPAFGHSGPQRGPIAGVMYGQAGGARIPSSLGAGPRGRQARTAIADQTLTMPGPSFRPGQSQQMAADWDGRSRGPESLAFQQADQPQRPATKARAVSNLGQAQSQQSPYAGSSPYGQPPAQPQFVGGQVPPPSPPRPSVPPGGVGNWGNQMQGRPDPFYMDGADPFGNWGGMDQFLGQRAAFVNNINAHRGMTASQGLPPRPYDFNQMWGQAGNMYQQGWQNPLQGLFG